MHRRRTHSFLSAARRTFLDRAESLAAGREETTRKTAFYRLPGTEQSRMAGAEVFRRRGPVRSCAAGPPFDTGPPLGPDSFSPS
jgi:hypothetical protein